MNQNRVTTTREQQRNTFLFLFIAGMGGLLYGYDIGIIGTALLYLDKCVRLSEAEVSILASAVMGGSLVSSLVAGALADWCGRKRVMIGASLCFIASVVLIVMSQGFTPLFIGRTLQGLCAGMVAVVIPIYLAECVPADIRGRGATAFQLFITLGLAGAMGAGAWYQSGAEKAVQAAAGNATAILSAQDHAWRQMFLTSAYPSVIFLLGTFFVGESPRWLFRRGRKQQALEVLQRTRPSEQASLELREMQELAHGSARASETGAQESVFQRRFIVPFLLAVALLGINQATGIVAVFTFPVVMLSQAGLSAGIAAKISLALGLLNPVATLVGIALVDKVGRRFLLKLGTSIIMIALLVGIVAFWQVESSRVDVRARLHQAVTGNTLNMAVADAGPVLNQRPMQLTVLYAYDGKEQVAIADNKSQDSVLKIAPEPKEKPNARLEIKRAKLGPAPDATLGYLVFACLLVYLAGFAVGPGVCLWLMSSELMPTRIRSFGMGVGVLFNALVSIGTVAIFLPMVGTYGYAAMWGIWFLCTALYFCLAAFLLPETKGKTLEEIERQFVRRDGVSD
jgi:MFS transporter, SP family, solute carrier family 2 (myo-inositol transporter), member 13